MPQLSSDQLRYHAQFMAGMETERSPWLKLWRELSDNYLPQRYRWLMSGQEYYANRARRQYIINNIGTRAARILAAGMMNGITSPQRPWFKLRVPGLQLKNHRPLALWLEEVERIMMRIMAESNFYNSMAILYLDMIVFGTGVVIIYEDFDSVIRCYNPPLGEFFLAQSPRMVNDVFSRKFTLKVHQYVRRWPDQRYWSDRVRTAMQSNIGAGLNQDVEISHFIAPNNENIPVSNRFPYYEVYYETKRRSGEGAVDVLELRGFNEWPGIVGRWEMSGNDPYGVCPSMDALGDNIDLQHTHREKAQMLEKVHKPPMLVDIALQNSPLAMMPKGITYVPNLTNTAGARPAFTVDARFDQLQLDIQSTEARIRDTFYNFLFTGITDLDTVRSAAEITSRETEKLILLGGVLERFLSEGLDPGITRVYSIGERAGMFPPPPPGYNDVGLEVQYVSVLSIAQRAVGTAPTERLLALVGELAAVYEGALDVPEFDQLIINYARDIGVRESEIKPLERIQAERAQKQAQADMATAVAAAPELTGAAKNLADAEQGGGLRAVQALIGG